MRIWEYVGYSLGDSGFSRASGLLSSPSMCFSVLGQYTNLFQHLSENTSLLQQNVDKAMDSILKLKNPTHY